jgi:hypothetical protein
MIEPAFQFAKRFWSAPALLALLERARRATMVWLTRFSQGVSNQQVKCDNTSNAHELKQTKSPLSSILKLKAKGVANKPD